jgi:hypothetical protein
VCGSSGSDRGIDMVGDRLAFAGVEVRRVLERLEGEHAPAAEVGGLLCEFGEQSVEAE